jgi:molecular chaperone GrpE
MTKKRTKTATDKKDNKQVKGKVAEESVNDIQVADETEMDKETGKDKSFDKKSEDTAGKQETTEKDRLEELETALKEWKDKYLRLSAEFDNYRKRTLREKTDMLKLANEDLLKDILPVVDDFERGMDNMDKSEDVDALKKGVHLIHSKFTDFLRQKGIQEIVARDKNFDIDFHEAITKIPAADETMKGKVVDVVEKGYLLNDKVIRYAKVVVGE